MIFAYSLLISKTHSFLFKNNYNLFLLSSLLPERLFISASSITLV